MTQADEESKIAIDIEIFTFVLFEGVFVSFVVVNWQLAVINEIQVLHCLYHILTINCLPLLILRYIAAFTRYKRYELTDTLLHTFAGFSGDFCIRRKWTFHDPVDICDWQKPVLVCQLLQMVVSRDCSHISRVYSLTLLCLNLSWF